MDQYKKHLKSKMDQFVHQVYRAAKTFPREELYITVAQLKRAALSIILNYVEGYARFKKGNQLQFLGISYGSLKETEYLIDFSQVENFILPTMHQQLHQQLDEIGAMLWTEIINLNQALNN